MVGRLGKESYWLGGILNCLECLMDVVRVFSRRVFFVWLACTAVAEERLSAEIVGPVMKLCGQT